LKECRYLLGFYFEPVNILGKEMIVFDMKKIEFMKLGALGDFKCAERQI